MNKDLVYFLDESIFEDGNPIYINYVHQQKDDDLHAHTFIEIAFIKSGQGFHRIGESTVPISQGSIFIINREIPHAFYPNPGTSLVVYNCIFLPGFLDYRLLESRDFSEISHHFLLQAFFPQEFILPQKIQCTAHEFRIIEELFLDMHFEYSKKQEGYTLILKAHVLKLLVWIFRSILKTERNQTLSESTHLSLIRKTVEHLKLHYNKEFKLDKLAMMSLLSPSHFSRQFKEYTGMTVSEYVQKIRINEACKLLHETDRKISDIALEVGYRDLKFFIDLFKRVTGCTPSWYRKTKPEHVLDMPSPSHYPKQSP